MIEILVTSLLLVGEFGFAQEQVITSIVKDAESGAPLGFSSVALKSTNKGTICNEKGEFVFKFNRKEGDTILISHLGYETGIFGVSNLDPNVIKLNPLTQQLNDLIIEGNSTLGIIEKMLEKLSFNYYSDPYETDEFYRLVSKKEQEYVQISEASYSVFHDTEIRNNQLKLHKSRLIENEEIIGDISIGARAETLSKIDFVLNIDEYELFTKKGLKNHDFEFEGYTKLDGHEAFHLSFRPKPNINNLTYQGSFVVDSKTFALLQIDFAISYEGIDKAKIGSAAQRMLLKTLGIQVKILEEAHKFSYVKRYGQYFLKDTNLTGKYDFSLQGGKKKFILDIKTLRTVTNTDLKMVTPYPNEEVLKNKALIESQTGFYDKEFWQEYQVISAEDDFATITKAISEKNEKFKDKKIE